MNDEERTTHRPGSPPRSSNPQPGRDPPRSRNAGEPVILAVP